MRYGKALEYEYHPRNVENLSHEAFKVQKKHREINFRKLFRKAGVRRISSNMNTVVARILREYLVNIVRKASALMLGDRSKTLRLIHIRYALK